MKKRKKIFIVIAVITGIIIMLGLFIAQTSRGGSLMIYLFGGSGVPSEIKMNCIAQTEVNVAKKFENPPAFPWKALDGLKGFWYYSYFDECLYENGYRFNGDVVKPSRVEKRGEVTLYTNGMAGFEAVVPGGTVLIRNNELDVDYHYKLYESTLGIGKERIQLHVYDYREDSESADALLNQPTVFSHTDATVTRYEKLDTLSNFGTTILVEQDDGNVGYTVALDDGYVLQLYGASSTLSITTEIVTSLGYTGGSH